MDKQTNLGQSNTALPSRRLKTHLGVVGLVLIAALSSQDLAQASTSSSHSTATLDSSGLPLFIPPTITSTNLLTPRPTPPPKSDKTTPSSPHSQGAVDEGPTVIAAGILGTALAAGVLYKGGRMIGRGIYGLGCRATGGCKKPPADDEAGDDAAEGSDTTALENTIEHAEGAEDADNATVVASGAANQAISGDTAVMSGNVGSTISTEQQVATTDTTESAGDLGDLGDVGDIGDVVDHY